MDLIKELSSNQTVLVIVSSMEYNETILNTVKKLSDKSLCYITLNKTSDALKEMFKKKKINLKNIVFIDAISKTIKEMSDSAQGCCYISSPAAITDLSLAINKFLKRGFEYLIFDSLTNLLVYESKAPVAKLVSSLTNNIRTVKTKAVFFALEVKGHEALIDETGMFVDRVIRLGKES